MKKDIQDNIKNIIKKNEVVLFMKGTSEMPMCGFSASVVNILNILKVKFLSVDVIESEELKQSIKDFSDWPTIPQLYIKKKFVGGCDIIQEMYKTGELQELLAIK